MEETFDRLRSQSFLWFSAFVVLMTACGDDGNNDTVLTGFSGVLIFGIIVWLIVHFVRKSD